MVKKLDLTPSKLQAIKGVINLWLSDPTLYCNSCGDRFNADMWKIGACCDNPQIGRNFDHARYVIKIIKEQNAYNKNKWGSNKEMTFRNCISLPARLLTTLEEYFKKYGEKLFNNEDELHRFMKAFPQFCRCEEV